MKNFHSFSKFSSFPIQFKILENKGLFIKKNHFSIFFFNSHSYRLDFLVYSLEFIIYLIISIFCPSEENIVFEPFFRANKYRGVLRCVDLFWVQFIIVKRFISRVGFCTSADRLHPPRINIRIISGHIVVLLTRGVLNFVDGNVAEVETHFSLRDQPSCWLFFRSAYITSQTILRHPKIVIHY